MTPFGHHPLTHGHAEQKLMRITSAQKNIRVESLSKFSKFVCAAWPIAKAREYFLCFCSIMDNYCLIFWPSVTLTQWSFAFRLSNTGNMQKKVHLQCSLLRNLTELTSILSFFQRICNLPEQNDLPVPSKCLEIYTKATYIHRLV